MRLYFSAYMQMTCCPSAYCARGVLSRHRHMFYNFQDSIFHGNERVFVFFFPHLLLNANFHP